MGYERDNVIQVQFNIITRYTFTACFHVEAFKRIFTSLRSHDTEKEPLASLVRRVSFSVVLRFIAWPSPNSAPCRVAEFSVVESSTI